MDIVGDTRAQGYAAPVTEVRKKMNDLGTMHMSNSSKAKICQCDNTTIEDINGPTMNLNT